MSEPSQLSQLTICIIGAGYIGLVAACCLAKPDHQVTCVEANEAS